MQKHTNSFVCDKFGKILFFWLLLAYRDRDSLVCDKFRTDVLQRVFLP